VGHEGAGLTHQRSHSTSRRAFPKKLKSVHWLTLPTGPCICSAFSEICQRAGDYADIGLGTRYCSRKLLGLGVASVTHPSFGNGQQWYVAFGSETNQWTRP
jgi:hypothetical protein